jgi:hypothetical protein
MPSPLHCTVLVLGLAACRGSETDPCSAVGAKVQTLLQHEPSAAELGRVFAERCRSDHWSERARTCITETTSIGAPKNCKQHLDAQQVQSLEAALAQEPRTAPLPPACLKYDELVAKVRTCEALPKEVRDQLSTNLDAAKARWEALADKELAAPECGMALSSLTHAAAECPGVKR